MLIIEYLEKSKYQRRKKLPIVSLPRDIPGNTFVHFLPVFFGSTYFMFVCCT